MLTEAQNAEVMLNWSLKNIDEVLKCEKKYGGDIKVNTIYALCHLIKGEPNKSYNLFKEVVFNKESSQEDKDIAAGWFGRLNNTKFFDLKLPQPNDYTYKQSIEGNDGWYKEIEKQNKVLMEHNDEKFKEYIKDLMKRIEETTGEEQAQAQFEVAELALNAKHFEQVITGYYGAIKANPNKAMYWGLCGGVINKYLKSDPLGCLFFIENAIDLDPENPRWYLTRCILLAEFTKDRNVSKPLKEMIVTEMDNLRKKAKSLCRPSQYILLKQLDDLYEFNKKVAESVKNTK